MPRDTQEGDTLGSHQGTLEEISIIEAVVERETKSTIESTMNGMSGNLKVQAEGKDHRMK